MMIKNDIKFRYGNCFILHNLDMHRFVNPDAHMYTEPKKKLYTWGF